MKVEFYTDGDVCHNVRFVGDSHASNEVILGIFYDCNSIGSADYLLEDIDKAINGKLPESDQKDYDFGDFISGELNKDFATLLPDGPITSKSYKMKTLELKSILTSWKQFLGEKKANITKEINVKTEVI